MFDNRYDVIVVGAGHAGVEAALASARLGKKTAIFTLYLDNIAMMSCNPSIGGPGKGHLIAELDILGAEIGKHTDKYNLQMKVLNETKGPAARVSRAQADKYLYRVKMKEILENQENLDIIQAEVIDIIVKEKKVVGVKTSIGIDYYSKAVVLATGTFLKGKIVIGDVEYSAGRQGENAANYLSESLLKYGIEIDRYQTATPPRVDKRTIDFSKLKKLYGNEKPNYFSIFTNKKEQSIMPTYLTFTTEETIKVTKELLKYSPIVSGIIETHGPRHCPSLDRKVLNFPDKYEHQIFLEQESIESNEIYVNGLTTAMPPFVQEKMLRTIKGLENAKIVRYGYAVEYDYIPAYQLKMNLENKILENLFLAGQINGTSGYEEAAAQGFLAGVNAVRKIDDKEPMIIDRTEGYIGVLIDDIIHKKTPEPYRVLPSRAEYRLTLRFDNAFIRLFDKAKEIGIIEKEKLSELENYINIIKKEIEKLKEIKITKKEINILLEKLGASERVTKGLTAYELLKLKEITYNSLKGFVDILELPKFVTNQIETIVKYSVFIEREKKQIEKFKKLENMKIPENFNYDNIKGISNIAKDGLNLVKPLSIGEASRISGVTGHDIALLIAHIKK
ncbi:tRNA uridine 5-carboxymethylaminomethyl modification enzyme [Hypnocyclicus thermotrophus]|uniref:tRNA uridine 5-carboxymethylaminomethyl modification enzyme MnmG n=1 Tax=Hypnocyclicus thermotrophus TaxID=1627895 RepID=A0AA46I5H3_9FUSO|nr:tRNA uridine-5-carboxymethylaminomethyl(34) synthesis enzyme MnmG [Hypnocyclicus thermotrophus]TDT69825.1 tRNA uridine 5-carboxymethylaminomethyl modification enzyme [Hypnocyclicus thermotrophus]